MKIISASIDLSKIDKSRIKKNDKNGVRFKNGAMYYNISIILNDNPDNYGKDIQIIQEQTPEERKGKVKRIFVGGGKTVWSSTGVVAPEGTPPSSNPNDLPF